MIPFQQRLLQWAIKYPVLAPTCAGILIRLTTAYYGLGFHARDDYFHVLEPALYWLNDPQFNWDTSSLAGAGIRSHLVPRLVYGLLLLFESLNISNPEDTLRLVYSFFGLYSAITIPAGYYLAKNIFSNNLPNSSTIIRWAPWVLALHFSMPYAGTRLLIEAMAIPPLVWGLYYCSSPRHKALFCGGLLIGIGCWFRYQLAAATPGLCLWVFLRARKTEGIKGGISSLLSLGAGGALAILIQGLFDLWTTGTFLGPLLANIVVNLNPTSELSHSNAFVYIGFWLLLMLPPLTFPLIPAVVRCIRKLPLISWPWLSFTLLHSLLSHKEERFMLPVLPLFLLLLLAAPGELETWNFKGRETIYRYWSATKKWSLGLHALALLLVIGNQSQANLREAMSTLRPRSDLETIVSLGPELQTYFLGRPMITLYRNRKFDALWLKETLDQIGTITTGSTALISFAEQRGKVGIMLMAEGLQCDYPTTINGWWFDRLIYRLNPKRNVRRSPVDLWDCSKPKIANAASSPPGESLARFPLPQNAR